ncbi:MAG: hypothetical protein OXG65_08715 [Chloroflexi bacterium]|nr:hypothetical protein [Chloroflexota bacterium]
MPADQGAVERLHAALEAIPRLRELAYRSPQRVVGSRDFQEWREDTASALAGAFGPDSIQVKSFASIQYAPVNFYFGASDEEFRQMYFRGLEFAGARIEAMIDELGEPPMGSDEASGP